MKTSGFQSYLRFLAGGLLGERPIHTGEWQSINTSGSKMHATHELLNVQMSIEIPTHDDRLLADDVHPSLPWAEEHFRERVSGIPYNPAPSHVRWPYAVRGNADHTDAATRFSHTYPERFWPKFASRPFHQNVDPNRGIRYAYGDLEDVVDLLVRSPLTRQAYLPVWFPEDTGAVHRERVPCTLGYHFMIRENRLDCWYAMRSCDIIRHLRNDVYLAGRLMQWVTARLNDVWGGTDPLPEGFPITDMLNTGNLHMTISSLHAFVGDDYRLRQMSQGKD